jgi:hypothetical protein
MMDEARFWSIVESTRDAATAIPREATTDFFDVHAQTLHDALNALPPTHIAAFEARFHELSVRAYRWDLWGAAYWMHGGCSDDSFMDFRACLISLGKDRYYAALANPDSLVEIIDAPDVPYMLAEGFQYIAGKVYESQTGTSIPDDIYDGIGHPEDPVGYDADVDHADDEYMSKHYPRLVAKLPEMGD